MTSPALNFATLPLGDQVRLHRVAHHWRQADLADIAGVSQAQVSDLERSEYVPFSIRRKILRALGLEAQI